MKLRIALLLSLVLVASSALAGDRWIPIAGTVGNFHTDTRILNPSGTKDIEVSAYFLPVNATDNSGRVAGTPVKIQIAKRSMKVLDDVVASVFSATGLGAILLTCPDDFVATSRIYAQVGASTLGQFSIAPGPGLAVTKGVVIQLKPSGAFRTNVGAVNPANATTTVTWQLYDKTNAKIATATKTMAAYEVTGPTNILGFFPGIPSGADLSDAWVSFSSTNPIFAYASVIDNASTDPTFIDMSQDTGSDPPVVTPTTKDFNVILSSFDISVNTSGLNALKVGDVVKMTVSCSDGTHGFALVNLDDGTALIPDSLYSAGGASKEFTFTVQKKGNYTYFCSFPSCGTGHTEMVGTFKVN